MNLSNACRPFSYTGHEFLFAQNHGIGRSAEASGLDDEKTVMQCLALSFESTPLRPTSGAVNLEQRGLS
jgi:hypothetical protein